VDVTNIFGYASAKASHASAKLDVIASEQDLILAVKTSYYAYLAAVENHKVQEEAVKRAEEQLKLVQSRFELGSASKSDVLKQKVRYGNDQLAFLRAKNSLTTGRAQLAYTIGLDPRTDWKFSTEYTVREYEGTLDDAMEFGLGHAPSLLSADKSLSAARSATKAAYAEYLPKLNLWANYSKFDGTQAFPVAFDYAQKSHRYGFQISWNIFDGFFRERQITNAKVQQNNARAQFSDLRNLTVSDIKTAYLDIQQLREQRKVSEENVEAAREDLRITQERYNLGAAAILDLLDAQVSLKEAETALIRVIFDLNLKIAQLEKAMGKM
jgi:outer membrane protein TolC